jgi:peptidylprolyl isomerase
MATAFPPFDGSAPKQQDFKEAPEMGIDPSKRYTAKLDTTLGEIVIALDAVKAPKTVNNFVFLALNHYYDGVIFHRIINGFMCQGGDPTGTGRGGPGYRFDDELPKPREYQIGSVAMANAGPNTNGSQFFIVSGPSGVGLPPAVQPVRPGREGPRRRRRDAEGAHRRRRQAEDRRGDQLRRDHRRRRLTS